MSDPRDRVIIEVHDPNCHGATSADGRREYAAHDHRISLPRHEAERILRTGHPMVERYRKIYGFRSRGS